MEAETRTFAGAGIEVRNAGDGGPRIEGYSVVFDRQTELMPGLHEAIDRRAFDGVELAGVVGLFNHDSNYVLGRSPATMRLAVDDRGLRYSADAPDTPTIRDLVVEPIRRGDVSGSSFSFALDWADDDAIRVTRLNDGGLLRTILKVAALYDVGPVSIPAYRETSAAVRSLEHHRRALGYQGGDGWDGGELARLRAENAELRAQLDNARRLRELDREAVAPILGDFENRRRLAAMGQHP